MLMPEDSSGNQDFNDRDDTTQERINKVEEAGLSSEVQDIYLPSGLASGSKRRHIERPLDTALRRSWITSEQFIAGNKFLSHLIGARSQIRFTVSRWEMLIDSSSS